MKTTRVYFDSTVNPNAIVGILNVYKKQFNVTVLMQSKDQYRKLFYRLQNVKIEQMNWRKAIREANVIITERDKLGRVFKRYENKIAKAIDGKKVRLWKNREKD